MDNEIMKNLKKINTMDKLRFSGESIRENSAFYDANQLTQIIVGFRHGLSVKEVFLYANPKLSFLQMRQIRVGFDKGLSPDQIKFYANSKYNMPQMNEIRECFVNGLNINDAKRYISEKSTQREIYQIREGLRNGLGEKIAIYANSNFNYLQMEQIRLGLEHGFNDSEISEYLDPKLEYTKMQEIRLKIERERIKI